MRFEAPIANPPIDANTDYFEAGGVIIGVERRRLDAAMVEAALDKLNVDEAGRQRALDEVPNVKDGGVEEFISLHVFGPDRSEYLRFDNIDNGKSAHYHYNAPRENFHTIEYYDSEANGKFMDWVFDCLENRLEPMLRKVHAEDVADKIDRAVFVEAISKVQAAVAVSV